VILYIALVITAFFLAHVAGPLLDQNRWAGRAPAAAATLWLGVMAGAIAAAAGLLALLIFGSSGPGHGVVEWFHRCVAHPHTGTTLTIALSAASLYAAGRGGRRALTRLRETRSARRRHREMLALVVSARQEFDDVCVLDHPLPVAYCLPDRKRPIVVSSGALDVLEPAELAAVLTHERAHLKGRHHLILALIDALACVTPWAATFRRARITLPILLEQAADDSAADRHGPTAVAGALRRLTILPCPAGALAAAENALEQRLERLERTKPWSRRRGLAWVGAVCSAALPLVIAAGWTATITLTC